MLILEGKAFLNYLRIQEKVRFFFVFFYLFIYLFIFSFFPIL